MKNIDQRDDYKEICDERKHIENVLCNRFNFFITFFSIIIAGAITSLSIENNYILWISLAVLIIGFIICFLMSFSIRRCQVKLNIILDILLMVYNHPNYKEEIIIDEIKKSIITKKKINYIEIIKTANPNISDIDINLIEAIENKLTKPRKYNLFHTCSYKDYIGFTIPTVCLIILLIITNILFIINKYTNIFY